MEGPGWAVSLVRGPASRHSLLATPLSKVTTNLGWFHPQSRARFIKSRLQSRAHACRTPTGAPHLQESPSSPTLHICSPDFPRLLRTSSIEPSAIRQRPLPPGQPETAAARGTGSSAHYCARAPLGPRANTENATPTRRRSPELGLPWALGPIGPGRPALRLNEFPGLNYASQTAPGPRTSGSGGGSGDWLGPGRIRWLGQYGGDRHPGGESSGWWPWAGGAGGEKCPSDWGAECPRRPGDGCFQSPVVLCRAAAWMGGQG